MKKLVVFTLLFCSLQNLTYSANTNSASEEYYNWIYKTCKVWGYLKYFHKNVGAGSLDWDNTLIDLVGKLDNLNNEEEFQQLLIDLIDGCGSYTSTGTQPDVDDSLCYNQDFSWINISEFSATNVQKLNNIFADFRPHTNNYLNNTTNYYQDYFNEDTLYYNLSNYELPSKPIRILALCRYWNIIEYFFPYRKYMDVNWDNSLEAAIPGIVEASDLNTYNYNMLKLHCSINDSHSFFSSGYFFSNIRGYYWIPIQLRYIENNYIVVNSATDKLKIGDLILAVDEKDISVLQDSLKYLVPGSNTNQVNYEITNFLISSVNNSKKFKISRDGNITEVTVQGSNTSYPDFEENIPSIKTINSNLLKIKYVHMGNLTSEEVPSIFAESSDAIIFDIRNYPQGTLWDLVPYIFNGNAPSALFHSPDRNFPGTFTLVPGYIRDINNAQYNNPIVILFDERTQSQAEYTAMTLENHRLAIKIGSQTSGADGNISIAYLPHHMRLTFTLLGTYYPDGRQTQRIGIQPDIYITPTIEGIKNGEDEVLAAAINYLTYGTDNENENELPDTYQLSQNYPNPFNPSCIIEYQIPYKEHVNLTIYDLLGREVMRIVNETQLAGTHKAKVNGENLASGLYFYRLSAGNFSQTRKMLLIK